MIIVYTTFFWKLLHVYRDDLCLHSLFFFLTQTMITMTMISNKMKIITNAAAAPPPMKK